MNTHLAHAFLKRCSAACAAVFLAAGLASCGGSRIDDDVALVFTTELTGVQAMPAATTNATATGLVTVDADRQTLTASIVTSGIADTEANIHQSSAGVLGPAVFPLAKTGTNVWTVRAPINSAQLATLRSGGYTMNLRSTTQANGELRGQLLERFPTDQQWARLHQVKQQSANVELQLIQLQDRLDWEDWHDWRFSGIGFTIFF